jgi:hypothetical protein
MKRYILTLSAVAALVLAGAVSAGEQLTSAQMDGVTAGGNVGNTATAVAWGNITATNAVATSQTQVTSIAYGEYSGVGVILSNANASGSAASTNGVGPLPGALPVPAPGAGDQLAVGVGSSNGQAFGVLMADTAGSSTNEASTIVNNVDPAARFAMPYAYSSNSNTTNAASGLVGLPSTAYSYATSAAVLQNY